MNDTILINTLKTTYDVKESDGKTLCRFKCHIIKLYTNHGIVKYQYLHDDLNSVAIQGILEGIKTYDPQYGTKLTTWCFVKMREKVREFITDEDKLNGYIEEKIQEKRISTDEQKPAIINSDTIQFLTEAIKRISFRQAEVLRKHLGMDYYNGEKRQTFVDIAKDMGISKQRVQKIYQQGIKNLRKEFLKVYPELFRN